MYIIPEVVDDFLCIKQKKNNGGSINISLDLHTITQPVLN